MNANSAVRVKVEQGGDQVVAHVGLHALGSFADRLGLGDSLSRRIPVTGERLPLHDRGKVLVQAMLMLAGGGEACSDIEHLRAQERLFCSVASDSTLYRTLRSIDPKVLDGLWEAMAEVRAGVWRRSSATSGSAPVVLDIDSSLVEVHSENKEGTGPTYKGGFGFNPMLCTADATGEVLAVRLRPGNAGTTTVVDHLDVLDAAVAALLTDLVDLDGWPPGARLIVRREPLHPGAQQSLFPALEHRYWGHWTDGDGDPVALDVAMRAHARVEDNIRRLRDSGFERFPFVDLDANRAWLAEVCFADALVRWFQVLCCEGAMAAAEPKTLRWSLWHSPARIVRTAGRWVVRILAGWPGADALIGAYRRIALLA